MKSLQIGPYLSHPCHFYSILVFPIYRIRLNAEKTFEASSATLFHPTKIGRKKLTSRLFLSGPWTNPLPAVRTLEKQQNGEKIWGIEPSSKTTGGLKNPLHSYKTIGIFLSFDRFNDPFFYSCRNQKIFVFYFQILSV